MIPFSLAAAGPAELTAERSAPAAASTRSAAGLAWTALVLLWAAQSPLFLAMPLTNDAAVYDLHARSLLRGGTLYRDLFEPNLPGVVWIHVAVRSLLGWSSVALRCFDLGVFAAILLLAAKLLQRCGASAKLAAWTTLACSAFYFSASEWLHCQRDTWLLLPALGGVALRLSQTERLRAGGAWSRIASAGALEGCVWGLGVWLKPHLVIPAAACWFVTLAATRPWRTGWRRCLADLGGLLAGGLAIGGLGIAWLVASDAWPAFVDTVRNWNPRYVRAGKEHWTRARFLGMSVRLFPWILIHLATSASVLWLVLRAIRGRRTSNGGSHANTSSSTLPFDTARWGLVMLCAAYGAWTLQAFALQHLFDYVHGPPILLALLGLAACLSALDRRALYYLASGGLALTVLTGPLLRPNRIALWTDCVQRAGAPELHDRLRRLATPEWQYQEQVAEWLAGQGARDGEVLAINDSLVHLYNRLEFLPPTRFVYIEQSYFLFPEFRDDFRQMIRETPLRFTVVNLIESGLSYPEAHAISAGDPLAWPPAVSRRADGRYPWRQPIVYRAGPYVVLDAAEPVGVLSLPAPRAAPSRKAASNRSRDAASASSTKPSGPHSDAVSAN